MRIATVCLFVVALSSLARADGGRGTLTGGARRFALVIGNNVPPHAGLSRLRYADDDAVRWAVTFEALGAEVEVLTELDEESRRLYGPLSFKPSRPTSASLSAAVGRLASRVSAAHAAGAHATFYFVYAGHGDVDGGHGYVSLVDSRLTRDDLGATVLGRLGADTNHVISTRAGRRRSSATGALAESVARGRTPTSLRMPRASSTPASSSPARRAASATNGRSSRRESSRTKCVRGSSALPTPTATGWSPMTS